MGLYSEEGSLRPTPPFDFAKSLDFLGMFPPMREDQTISEMSMTKAVRVGGRAIVFQLKPTGTIKMPGQIAGAPKEALKALVKHERREEYLGEVIIAFNQVDERFLRTADYDRVEEWLKNIRGIGDWSAKLILLRGLGRMEKLAVEKRLIAAAGRVYVKPLTLQRLHVIADRK